MVRQAQDVISNVAWNVTDTISDATSAAFDQIRNETAAAIDQISNETADAIDDAEDELLDGLEDATEDMLRELGIRDRDEDNMKDEWAVNLLADAPKEESNTSVIVLSSAAGFVAAYVALTINKKCSKSDEEFMRV